MKFNLGNKTVTFGLSAKGKDLLGYILAVLFLAGISASPIWLYLLFY